MIPLFYQYCVSMGAILVTESDFLFMPFHSFIVSAVKFISDTFYLIPKPPNKDNFYFNLWHQCQFTRHELFSDMSLLLGDFICRLHDYLHFKHNIPMLDLLFHYLLFSDQVDACLIGSHMTRTEFNQFILMMHPIQDVDVDLCGYTPKSAITIKSRSHAKL